MPKYYVDRTVLRQCHEMFTVEAENAQSAEAYDGGLDELEDFDWEDLGIAQTQKVRSTLEEEDEDEEPIKQTKEEKFYEKAILNSVKNEKIFTVKAPKLKTRLLEKEEKE